MAVLMQFFADSVSLETPSAKFRTPQVFSLARPAIGLAWPAATCLVSILGGGVYTYLGQSGEIFAQQEWALEGPQTFSHLTLNDG